MIIGSISIRPVTEAANMFKHTISAHDSTISDMFSSIDIYDISNTRSVIYNKLIDGGCVTTKAAINRIIQIVIEILIINEVPPNSVPKDISEDIIWELINAECRLATHQVYLKLVIGDLDKIISCVIGSIDTSMWGDIDMPAIAVGRIPLQWVTNTNSLILHTGTYRT